MLTLTWLGVLNLVFLTELSWMTLWNTHAQTNHDVIGVVRKQVLGLQVWLVFCGQWLTLKWRWWRTWARRCPPSSSLTPTLWATSVRTLAAAGLWQQTGRWVQPPSCAVSLLPFIIRRYVKCVVWYVFISDPFRYVVLVSECVDDARSELSHFRPEKEFWMPVWLTGC